MTLSHVEHLETLLTHLCAGTVPEVAQFSLRIDQTGIRAADQPGFQHNITKPRAAQLVELAEPAGPDAHTWRISADKVELADGWHEQFAEAQLDVPMQLGMPHGTRLEAHFDGLIVHGPGPVAVPAAAIKRADAVARVFVELDSTHNGGEFASEVSMERRRRSSDWSYGWSSSHGNAHAIRLGHEPTISEVTSGYVIHLSFTLTSSDPIGAEPDPLEVVAGYLQIAARDAKEPVALLLSDDYTDLDFADHAMRPEDEALVRMLCSGATRAGFEWAYAGGRIDVEDDDYHGPSADLQLSWWNDTECPGVIDLTVRRECILDPQHLIEMRRSNLRRTSHGYRSASACTALLMWPRAIGDEVRADAKPSWAIESALAALDAQGVPRAKRLLGLAARGAHDDDRIRSFRLDERHRFDSTDKGQVVF
jgi:hypothetical protein